MRVLYVLPYDWGGMPHYTAELANAASKYAEVVVMGSKNIDESLFAKEIKIVKVFEPIDFSLNNLKKGLKIKNITGILSFKNVKQIDQIDPDVIHLTTPLIPPLSFFILFYRIDRKYPIVHTTHGIVSNSGLMIKILEEVLVGSLERFIRFRKVIVHTDNDKEALKNKGINAIVIPHGAYSFFDNLSKNNLFEKNTILFFGNIRKYKGLDYLLKGFPDILKSIPDARLIIAGDGDMSEYMPLINNMNTSSIEIHNTFISNEKVSQLFHRTTIVALPYTEMSGQSGVLNIACALGKPIVASDVGGFKDVVIDGKTGLLVPPKDSKSLSDAIVKLLIDEPLRTNMSSNLLNMAQALSWDNIAKKHIALYESVIFKR